MAPAVGSVIEGAGAVRSRVEDELHRALDGAWSDRRIAFVAVVGIAVAAALLSAWLTPRGPMTTGQSLWTMVLGFAVGLGGGLATRSRWTLPVASLAFIATFEVARLGTDGPTVDGAHLSTYGLIALVTGRVFHGVLLFAPMALGVTYGRIAARRLSAGPATSEAGRALVRWSGRIGTGVATLALLGLVALLARPAGTDAIRGSDGKVLPGSVAELTRVELGGHDQALMIRGHSVENPVLLFLAGGPGGTELGAMRNHLPALEEDFTVVTWDQRGAGKSYTELDPTSTLTLDGMVADTIELTNYLRDRFDEERIYLVANSWGTILGVRAAQLEPGLFHAFVGAGQMVSPLETDRIFYEDTLAWAEDSGNDGLAQTLRENGPPPYPDNILAYEPGLSFAHEVYPYDHTGNSEGGGGMSENLFVGEYTLTEQVRSLSAFLDSFAVLYPQLQEIDFRQQASRLEVPVYLVQGAHEARGRAELADEWFAMLEAPSKELVLFERSGHRPLFEQPDQFVEVMRRVLGDTHPAP
jgi:pimeloyl-ACP methyl ester carboxylesterase